MTIIEPAYTADAAIQFLKELITEYNRLTGRTEPASIPAERWEALRKAITGSDDD